MRRAQNLVRELECSVAQGRYRPGDPLPSVRDLALSHRINPNTVVRALACLVGEGIVFVEERRGHFVSPAGPRRAREILARQARAGLGAATEAAIEAGLEADEVRSEIEAKLLRGRVPPRRLRGAGR